jgi:hypothetical protein
MKVRVWLIVLVLVAAPAARADDTGVSAVLTYGALGVAGGLLDIGLTIYDIKTLVTAERPSKQYGLIETVVAVPQMAIAAYLFASHADADGARPLSAVWFLWAGALAAHGIWTCVRPDTTWTPVRPVEPASRITIGARPIEEARKSGSPLLWSVSGRF